MPRGNNNPDTRRIKWREKDAREFYQKPSPQRDEEEKKAQPQDDGYNYVLQHLYEHGPEETTIMFCNSFGNIKGAFGYLAVFTVLYYQLGKNSVYAQTTSTSLAKSSQSPMGNCVNGVCYTEQERKEPPKPPAREEKCKAQVRKKYDPDISKKDFVNTLITKLDRASSMPNAKYTLRKTLEEVYEREDKSKIRSCLIGAGKKGFKIKILAQDEFDKKVGNNRTGQRSAAHYFENSIVLNGDSDIFYLAENLSHEICEHAKNFRRNKILEKTSDRKFPNDIVATMPYIFGSRRSKQNFKTSLFKCLGHLDAASSLISNGVYKYTYKLDNTIKYYQQYNFDPRSIHLEPTSSCLKTNKEEKKKLLYSLTKKQPINMDVLREVPMPDLSFFGNTPMLDLSQLSYERINMNIIVTDLKENSTVCNYRFRILDPEKHLVQANIKFRQELSISTQRYIDKTGLNNPEIWKDLEITAHLSNNFNSKFLRRLPQCDGYFDYEDKRNRKFIERLAKAKCEDLPPDTKLEDSWLDAIYSLPDRFRNLWRSA